MHTASIAPQTNDMITTTGWIRAASPSTMGPTTLSIDRRSAIANPKSKAAAQMPFCCTATKPTSVAEANGPMTGMSSRMPTASASRTALGRWKTGPKPIHATRAVYMTTMQMPMK